MMDLVTGGPVVWKSVLKIVPLGGLGRKTSIVITPLLPESVLVSGKAFGSPAKIVV